MKSIKSIRDVVVRPENLTEQVYKIIKRRITSGELEGGQHLVERVLAAELKVSKTPVREALARLEREGLVVNIPGRGVVVRKLTPQEVEDILEVREVLEGLAAEKAAVAISPQELSELGSILAEGEEVAKTRDLARYKELDTEFHRIVRNASGNQKVAELMGFLEDQIRLVMVTSVTLPGRPQNSLAEHRGILEALKNRDPRLAGERAREHVRNVRRAVAQHWEVTVEAP